MIEPIDNLLLQHFYSALERIAPNKADDLRKILDKHKLRVEIEDTNEPFRFHVFPDLQKIGVGNGALRRLWATACGYAYRYQPIADAKQQQEFDLKSNDRMQAASMLLKWTIEAECDIAWARKAGEPIPQIDWPSDLPWPTQDPEPASGQDVADELFSCAFAFFLCHELAHIWLGHKLSENAGKMRRFEDEADMAAAEWMLGGLDQNDKTFRKLALGVALALGWFASVTVFVPDEQVFHSSSCERLYRVIDRFATDKNHKVWSFIRIILRATMDADKMDYNENRKATSPKDDVEYCISVFKKYQARRP